MTVYGMRSAARSQVGNLATGWSELMRSRVRRFSTSLGRPMQLGKRTFINHINYDEHFVIIRIMTRMLDFDLI